MGQPDTYSSNEIRSSGTEHVNFHYEESHVTLLCTKSLLQRAVDNRLDTQLLRSSCQVHQEAALLPYALNTFSFVRGDVFTKFLFDLMPVQQRAIRRVTIDHGWGTFARRANLFSKLTGLTEVTIYRICHFYGLDGTWHVIDGRDLDKMCNWIEQLPIKKARLCLTRWRGSIGPVVFGEASARKAREWSRTMEERLEREIGKGAIAPLVAND